MEGKQSISKILKVLGVLDYAGNQDKVRSIVKQGRISEKSQVEISLLLLAHFNKRAVSYTMINKHVDTLMQIIK